jgi:hypothetical protein
MRKLCRLMMLGLPVALSSMAAASEIRGEYVEARNADVFTGPCFSNAEVLIYGKQAVLAWKVRQGSWKGVDLSGLCVAAAVRGNMTFSEDQPDKAISVLIVDSQASQRQHEALIDLAKSLGGTRLNHVIAVKSARMKLMLEEHGTTELAAAPAGHSMPASPRASFWAAGLAKIVTRPLDDRDHFCGNETVAYPPLSRGVDVQPAFTLGHEFKGEGLDTRWDDPNCRSSFVGHFAL